MIYLFVSVLKPPEQLPVCQALLSKLPVFFSLSETVSTVTSEKGTLLKQKDKKIIAVSALVGSVFFISVISWFE